MALLGEQATVTASCGHETVLDLSEKPIDRRAGFVQFIESRGNCPDCFAVDRDKRREREKRAWLAEQRKKEAQEAEQFEIESGLPLLEGSEKAVAWARRVRHELLHRAHEVLVFEGGIDTTEFAEKVEEPAKLIGRAGWWLDQKDCDPNDLPQLLEAGISDASNLVECENDA